MTTIYLVNENPDGSGRWLGRWLDPASDRNELWSEGGGLFYLSRSAADYAVKVFGGHVVEFTVGGADIEKACAATWKGTLLEVGEAFDLEWNRDYGSPTSLVEAIREHFGRTSAGVVLRDMADGAGVEMEGVPLVNWGWADLLQAIVADHAAKPEPREPDHWLARKSDGSFDAFARIRQEYAKPELAAQHGTPVPVYVGEPPPAPPAECEADAIMVCCKDGVLDWGDVLPFPLEPEDWEMINERGYTTRKVYLDTPPPAGDAALAEVSRLGRALDAARREAGVLQGEVTQLRLSQDADIRELKRLRGKLDELAKQEPVAWRRRLRNGEMTSTADDRIAKRWRDSGLDVQPLYAAPKPADKVVPGPSNAPASVMEALHTCAACNAGPGAIGPVHTCEPAPADTPDEPDPEPLKPCPSCNSTNVRLDEFAFGTCDACATCGPMDDPRGEEWNAMPRRDAAPADTPDRDEAETWLWGVISTLEHLAEWAEGADHEDKALHATRAVADVKVAIRALKRGGK